MHDRGFEVRAATPDDAEVLFDIRTSVEENHQSREELAAMGVTPDTVAGMLRGPARAWIGEVAGRPVAFSMARADVRDVFAMFVRPGFEGRGLGRALMEEAEEWLFAQGIEEIWLSTGGDPASRANGFYRAIGWTEAGVMEDGQLRYIRRQRP